MSNTSMWHLSYGHKFLWMFLIIEEVEKNKAERVFLKKKHREKLTFKDFTDFTFKSS